MDRLPRIGTPGDRRRNRCHVDRYLTIETGVGIRHITTPTVNCSLEICRHALAALQVGEGRVVGSHEPSPGASLDRHVADRHAPLHREVADRVAGIFDEVPCAASGAELSNHRQHHVFRRHAEATTAIKRHAHRRLFGLHECLRREHMTNLARTDPEGERTKGTVR